MNNKHRENLIIGVLIIGLFGAFLLGLWGGATLGNKQTAKYFEKEIALLKEKETYLVGRLHALHGIESSEYADGQYFFMRKGKKSRL